MADEHATAPALTRVFEAWRLTPSLHHLGAPADDAAIRLAEDRLGRPLPAHLANLVRLTDGASVLHGNVGFEPVAPSLGRDLVGFASRLRGQGWPIPQEMLAIGSDGGGSILGLWYPSDRPVDGTAAVVVVADPEEADYMAILGTDLARFLTTWTAYYLVTMEAPVAALDALDIPEDLRVSLNGPEACTWWTDPQLQALPLDPFEARLDAAEVGRIVTSLGSSAT